MKISFAGLSDLGQKRERNEDAFLIIPENNFLILCDGMGGLDAGDVASWTAVNTIAHVFKDKPDKIFQSILSDLEKSFSRDIDKIVAALRVANKRIFNLSRTTETSEGMMGTTAEVVHFSNNNIVIGHVGDSQVYRLRDFELKQITEDHSWVNELLQDKEITKAEAETFQNKNVITRALGVKPRVKIDIIVDTVRQDDIYLLCSDGLSGPLSAFHIKEIMLKKQHDLDKMANCLIDAANQNGGPDNITVALAKIENTSSNKITSISELRTTIPEESDLVLHKENELLRELFGKAKRKKAHKSKKLAIPLIFLILILSLVVFKFLNFENNGKQQQLSTTPPGQSPIPPAEKIIEEKVVEEPEMNAPKTGTVKFIFWPLDKRQATIYIDDKIVGELNDVYDEGLAFEEGEHKLTLKLNDDIIYQGVVKIEREMEITIPYEED